MAKVTVSIVTLELTLLEATVLRELLNHIAGREDGLRAESYRIDQVLLKIGVERSGHANGVVSFDD